MMDDLWHSSMASCDVLCTETTPLINSPVEKYAKISPSPVGKIKPLKRRWYILFVFSSLAFIQGAVWNTWGPIALSAFKVFPQWSNSTIALLSNWGGITFILFLFPMTWLRNYGGLRCAVLCTGFLMAFGTGIRCITLKGFLVPSFIHVGQFLNGIAGIIVNTAPLLVSAEWFPLNERTTATAISTVMTVFGAAFAFIMGPLLVSNCGNSSTSDIKPNKIIEQNILFYMQIEFFVTITVVFCICIYFPSRPFRPPTFSASLLRYNFKESFLKIIKHKNLLLLTCAYGLSSAVIGNWLSLMNLPLETVNISQVTCGWLGFTTEVVGCIGAVLVGRFSDIFRKRMKCTILSGLVLCSILTIVFAIMLLNLFTVLKSFIYAVIIMMGCLNISLAPLFFELASELAYPVDENITGALLSGSGNVVGVIYLLLFFIPNIGIAWMNWFLMSSILISIPITIAVNEVYTRSVIDDQHCIQ